MSKHRIWVPGERDDYNGGVLVTDVATDRIVGVNERVGFMTIPTRRGMRQVPAVRGELVRADDKYAIVKLPGGPEVKVRVLGAWHLEGLSEPQLEEAGTEPTNAA